MQGTTYTLLYYTRFFWELQHFSLDFCGEMCGGIAMSSPRAAFVNPKNKKRAEGNKAEIKKALGADLTPDSPIFDKDVSKKLDDEDK